MNIPTWQMAKVIRAYEEAQGILSLELQPEQWAPHIAGQHYELRLPGDQLSRKYSVVSSPMANGRLFFGVKLFEGGVLSPRLWQLQPGDSVELRGPLGESFIWQPQMGGGPLVLIGAGSGVTPLLAIYDHYQYNYPQGIAVLLVSAKTPAHILQYDRLRDSVIARLTATQGRIDAAYLQSHLNGMACKDQARCFVCGPVDFIDMVVDELLAIGFPPDLIRAEKFE